MSEHESNEQKIECNRLDDATVLAIGLLLLLEDYEAVGPWGEVGYVRRKDNHCPEQGVS